jgi:hypothetical protein
MNLLNSFQFIGQFTELKGQKNLITLSVDSSVSKETMKSAMGRVYVFVEEKTDGSVEILKIGKSSDKGGLLGTLGFCVSALSGTPGQNRFCLHHMISDKLKSGSIIKIYVRFTESVKKKISGLTSEVEVEVPLDVTYVEHLCLQDYKSVYGSYPSWNFQESGNQLPKSLMESFGKFIADKKKS